MPIDGVSSSSYRDQWTVAGQLGTDSTESTGQVWNAVFVDQDDMGVSVDDFLSLMVAQLTNQDFMNPVDDTQYLAQLAQFSSMQAMQEMSEFMKTNYVTSMIGKKVTAANISVSGELKQQTGIVEKISLLDNEYTLYVNGQGFSLSEIMEIHAPEEKEAEEEEDAEPEVWGQIANTGMAEYLIQMMDKNVTIGGADGAENITGVVEKVTAQNGKYQVYVNGSWYDMDSVLEVNGSGSGSGSSSGSDGKVEGSGEATGSEGSEGSTGTDAGVEGSNGENTTAGEVSGDTTGTDAAPETNGSAENTESGSAEAVTPSEPTSGTETENGTVE